MESRGYRVIVLAAQRGGVADPLAVARGVSHKCLVPIAGKPLIAHVVGVLAAYPAIEDVVISVEPDAADTIRTALGSLSCSHAPVIFAPAAGNLADSVFAASEGHWGPLLITTADNALIAPTSLDAMLQALRIHDAAIAFAPRDAVLAAHPDGQRRFYRFLDGEYSNCNLYGLAHRRALKAAELFRGGGQFAKKASRIVEAFGLFNLLLLRARLLTMPLGLRRISARVGLDIAPVLLKDGSQAIDVDNERTYAIVEQLLEARGRLATSSAKSIRQVA